MFFKHVWMPKVIFCTDSTLWPYEIRINDSFIALCNCVLIKWFIKIFFFKFKSSKTTFNFLCALWTLLHHYMTISGYNSCIYNLSVCPKCQITYSIKHYIAKFNSIPYCISFFFFFFIFFLALSPNVSPGLVKCCQRQVVPTHWSDPHIGSFRRSRAELSGFVNLLLSWFYIAFFSSESQSFICHLHQKFDFCVPLKVTINTQFAVNKECNCKSSMFNMISLLFKRICMWIFLAYTQHCISISFM